jgi:hypothetical protein
MPRGRASLESGAEASVLKLSQRLQLHSVDESVMLDEYTGIASSLSMEEEGECQPIQNSNRSLNQTRPNGSGGVRRGVARESFNDWKQKNEPNHAQLMNKSNQQQMLKKQQQQESCKTSLPHYASSYADSMGNYSLASSKEESELDFDDDATMATNVTTDSGLRRSIQAATSNMHFFRSKSGGLLSERVDEEEEDFEEDLFMHADEEDDDASIDIPLGSDSARGGGKKTDGGGGVMDKYAKNGRQRRPLSGQSKQSSPRSSGRSLSSSRSSMMSRPENGKHILLEDTTACEGESVTPSQQSFHLSKDSLESYLPKGSAHVGASFNGDRPLRNEGNTKNFASGDTICENGSSKKEENEIMRRQSSGVTVRSQKRRFAFERIRTFARTEVARPNFKRNVCIIFLFSFVVVCAIALGLYFGSANRKSSTEVESNQGQGVTGGGSVANKDGILSARDETKPDKDTLKEEEDDIHNDNSFNNATITDTATSTEGNTTDHGGSGDRRIALRQRVRQKMAGH